MLNLRTAPSLNVVMIAAVCGVAVAAVLLLQPAATVRLEGQLAMLEPEAALSRLETASARTPLSGNLAHLQAQLALDAGDLPQARRALAPLDEAPRATAEIADELSQVDRMQGDLPAAIADLARAYGREPTTARRQKLSLWYRYAHDPAGELATLQSAPPADLTPAELNRLSELLRGARRFDDLEALYRAVADAPSGDFPAYRQRLMDIMLEDGRAPQALNAAAGWYRRDKDPDTLDMAVSALIDRGALNEAVSLARYALTEAPRTSFGVLERFAISGHRGVAFELQDMWLREQAMVPPAAWQTLVDVAETTGDLRGLRTALMQTPRASIPDEALDAALREFLRYQGVRSLLPFSRYLTPAFLGNAPLIGAAWMADQGQLQEASAYLELAAHDPLGPRDAEILLSLARSIHALPELRASLSGTDAGPLTSRIDAAFTGPELPLDAVPSARPAD